MFRSFINAFSSHDMTFNPLDDFKQEDPSLESKRIEAKRKMQENNRMSLLQGGAFSRGITVLTGANK